MTRSTEASGSPSTRTSYTNSLETAIAIAATAHEGQTDKGGAPYIMHPLRVMMAVLTLDEKIVAVFHDVVEDTDLTFEDLIQAGYAPHIIDAIRSVTKMKGETRLEAAHRAAKNKIGRVVKLADVADNMNISRIPNPAQRDFDRMSEYQAVKDILQAADPANHVAH
jgi:GTP diphosphokinase / guanosine-3',5'-bis(diphosphate) 3'-diphosphatase